MRVLHPSAELDAWELVVARPDHRLRGVVDRYSGYTETVSVTGVLRQEVPGTRVPLIVNFGSRWRLSDGAAATSFDRRDSFLAGLYESSTFVAADGPAACVQVDFTPIGAHLFLGVPMNEVANRVVDLEDLLGRSDLAARLEDATTWEARFDLLESLIVARVAEARRPSPEIVWAWRALEQTNGAVRVSALATKLGRSRRHLATRFREHVGLGPKKFARVVRFSRTVEVLRPAGVSRSPRSPTSAAISTRRT